MSSEAPPKRSALPVGRAWVLGLAVLLAAVEFVWNRGRMGFDLVDPLLAVVIVLVAHVIVGFAVGRAGQAVLVASLPVLAAIAIWSFGAYGIQGPLMILPSALLFLAVGGLVLVPGLLLLAAVLWACLMLGGAFGRALRKHQEDRVVLRIGSYCLVGLSTLGFLLEKVASGG